MKRTEWTSELAAASLVVRYGTFGRISSRLDEAPVDLTVTAGGLVFDVRVHGDVDAPRATFTLLSDCGGTAIVAVDTETYLDCFGEIVHGRFVSVSGKVVRPFEDGPTHIHAVTIPAPAIRRARRSRR